MKIGVMVVDLEAQGVFVDIDVVPYLLGGLVVDVGRRSGGSRTRDGPRGELGLGLGVVVMLRVVKARGESGSAVGIGVGAVIERN